MQTWSEEVETIKILSERLARISKHMSKTGHPEHDHKDAIKEIEIVLAELKKRG